MDWSYDKLWRLLIDKHMKRSELREQTGISTSTLAKMGKNEIVSMDVLAKLCKALQCDIGDIIEYVGKGE
ncbi:DNA-binding transcriptional regulator, XRE family [Ruminococcaceae bacterium BL-6]|nr:DNA-binding transcriptional regulator, XRE family [Ruminococcaceae bacterium BL-6]